MSMWKGLIAALWIGGAVLAGAAAAAPDPETTLIEEMAAATWPGDIVALAADYRRRFPRGPHAADAASRGERAARALQAVESKDVNLPRKAFADAAAAHPALREEVRQALLGDAAAALRIAHAWRDAPDGSAKPLAYLEWLHYAAALDEPAANYELSRHYRREGQMPLAAKYQQRAVDLGFVLPRELDSVRK